MLDPALGWSGIEDWEEEMPKGENEEDDPPDERPKPCGAALGNMVELERGEVNDGGDVNRGGGDDMLL